MGGAILRGYAPAAEKKGDSILVYDKKEDVRSSLAREFKAVTACGAETELAEKSDVLILGVKPNLFETVLPEIAGACTRDKLIISMAAGVSISRIEQYLGSDRKIIRIMPNTPAQVGEAMIAVCRNQNVEEEDFSRALEIFQTIGKAEEVEESLIHCVIGVSGSLSLIHI